MKLKVNSSGSWATVLDFDPRDERDVRSLAFGLAIRSSQKRLKFKIEGDDGLTCALLVQLAGGGLPKWEAA